MNNKLILKLLSLILVIVMLSSVFASCVSNVEPSNTSTTANGEATTTTSSTNGTKPGATTKPNPDGDCAISHTDDENDGFCDHCGMDVVETIDFYNINDLHGKFENTDDISKIIERIRLKGVRIFDIEITKAKNSETKYPNAIFSLRLPKKLPHSALVTDIASLEVVRIIEEL